MSLKKFSYRDLFPYHCTKEALDYINIHLEDDRTTPLEGKLVGEGLFFNQHPQRICFVYNLEEALKKRKWKFYEHVKEARKKYENYLYILDAAQVDTLCFRLQKERYDFDIVGFEGGVTYSLPIFDVKKELNHYGIHALSVEDYLQNGHFLSGAALWEVKEELVKEYGFSFHEAHYFCHIGERGMVQMDTVYDLSRCIEKEKWNQCRLRLLPLINQWKTQHL